MPFFERARNVRIPQGMLTDVGRDYNSSHSVATSNTGIIMEGSSGGRVDGPSNISIHNISVGNQDGQGGSEPAVICCHDNLDIMAAEQSPSDIYARLLLPKKQGYPLWFPEPDEDLPSNYRSIGVDVGDVGIITSDGAFDFLFNICHPADDPVNWLGVPDDFVPLTLQRGDVRRVSKMYDAGTHISSAHIYKARLREEEPGNVTSASSSCAGFKFECSGSTGAVLMLPEGGSRVDLRKRGLFYQYAAHHAISWYKFVNGPDLDRRAENGSLYLVTGCDKCPAWGVASYCHPFGGTQAEDSLKFMAVGQGEDGTSLAYTWENYSTAAVRTGRCEVGAAIDSESSEPANPSFNQCVFIRGLRISVRPGLLRVLLGNRVKVEEGFNSLSKGGTTSNLPESARDSSFHPLIPSSGSSCYEGKQQSKQKVNVVNEYDISLESISDASNPYHPLASINNYLLEFVEGSKIAITHDDDWHALLEESDSEIPEDKELIRRLSVEKIRQHGDVVFLQFDEVESMQPESPTVLVPSSSPLAPEVNQRPYQSYSQPPMYDVAPVSGLISSNSWDQPHRKLNIDPLSVPSGLHSNQIAVHASLRRPRSGGEGQMEGVQEDGRPRKRINRGLSLNPSHDVYDVADSPLSPEIQLECAGKRRHIVNNLLDSLSSCSDDSLPDISEIVAGPSNPLIVNGRPSTPNISPAGDPKFTHFMTTIPLASPTQVQNSWIQAQGDVKKDAELRFDSFWVDPRKYQGIVKETKVATKAQRMAAKERGKESMIYANRSVLEGKPGISAPPVSKRGIGLNFPSFPMDSSTSQIRSRITVVCAECKRLKLKCDRRNPCGSCTKRDTIMRCIYSPAAAEKVDLHSLNNRLSQVEGLLSLLTAGKNPPPFQSSYPLAQIPLIHHKSGRPHISPGTASSMISISMHDMSSIWLSHCNLDVDLTSKKDSVKLEPSLLDPIVSPSSPNLLPLTTFYSQNYYPSAFSDFSYILPPHPSSSPASSSSSIQNNSTTTSPPSTSHPPKPHPTPALLALLPLPSTRTRLLQHARTAYPELRILIPWGRVLDLSADPEELHEREKEKAKDKKTHLANTLFYGIRVDEDGSQTFPLFVVLCYLLSFCARNVTEEGVDKSFLYAFAGQAMGVWETYRQTHEQDQDQEAPDHNGVGFEEDDAAVGNEEVDYVLACLMQVMCMVRGADAKNNGMRDAFPLMGKLVNLARTADLARDPDSVDAKKAPKDATKERKRMLWWEIMFYDTFISDVLNQPANVTLTSYSTRWPACASPSLATFSFSHASSSSRNASPSQHQLNQHQSQAHIDDGEIDLDANIDEEDDHRNSGKTRSKTRGTKGRAKAALLIKPREAEIGNGENNLLEVLGVRCRLTQLTQTIKHHLSRPFPSDPEPTTDSSSPYGYTLDQAVQLEGEIRTWVAQLPPYLRLDGSFPSSSPSFSFSASSHPSWDAGAGVAGDDIDSDIFQFGAESSTVDPSNRALSATSVPPSESSSSSQSTSRLSSTAILAAELAILANRLIMAVYIPFLRPSPSSLRNGGAGSVHPAYVAQRWSPASRATVDAARGVVRAGMVMYQLFVDVGATSAGGDPSGKGVQGMILGEFYSLEKALVDAAVVCTHAGVVNGGVKVQEGKDVLKDAVAALEVLAAMGVGRQPGEMMRVVDALRRKVDGLGVS